MVEGSILASAIYFINNTKGLAPSPVYTEVGVYLLLVNTWSLQGVTITVFFINSVHGLPVQSH
jgi:hypothetical protein